MVRSRIAAVVAAGTLAFGGGIALAQTDPEDPTLDTTETEVVTETEGTEAEGTENETEEVVEAEELVEAEEVDGLDGEGPPEGSHGAVVSAAAKDHSHDEACGNHGRWVSHWARHGEAPECAAEASTEEALPAETDEQTGEADETSTEETEASAASSDDGDAAGKGKGKGRGKKR